MATLNIQQKAKLVEMLSKYYTLDNEAGILNFIENVASDCTDKTNVRLELALMAYALMGKERTFDTDSNSKQVCIRFNPYPNKLMVIKTLKEIPELHLDLKSAKEIADSQQIVVDADLSELVKTAIFNAGGTIERIQIL